MSSSFLSGVLSIVSGDLARSGVVVTVRPRATGRFQEYL